MASRAALSVTGLARQHRLRESRGGRHFVRSAVLVIAYVLMIRTAASATHSVGSPRAWWDANNDGLKNDSGAITLSKAGGNWTPTKEERSLEATAEWRNDSAFDPSLGIGSNNLVFLDGSAGCLGSFPQGVLAVNCITAQVKQTPSGVTYHDLTDTDIFFNAFGHAWNYQTTGYDPFNVRYSFRGILVHELGHSVQLDDLYGCEADVTRETMCGSISEQQSYWAYSITGDDRNGASFLYAN